jgi:hypothetical protein
MTEPNTTKMAKDMSAAERAAFIAQCKKLESAPSQTPPDTRSARDMTERERQEWLADYKRRHR